ncbi:MAG: putative Ig domain-containing protein, partial [Gammaproteobacteria bacterium]
HLCDFRRALAPFSVRVVSPSDGGGTSTANRPPRITGAPPTAVVVGERLGFVPTSSDPDGDRLTFSATNLAPWMSLDPASGRVTGTPGPGDVRRWSNIRITVSDGTATDTLGPFGVEVTQVGAISVTVSWTPPTEREDGTVLSNLAGHKIYVGRSRDALDRVIRVSGAGISRYVVDDLSPGTWFFRMSAFDSDGAESKRTGLVRADL